MGGSSGGSSTIEKSDPWAGQQPYLEHTFEQAANLYGQGPQQYYGGSTVAGMSGQTQAGLEMLQNRGLMGSDQNRIAQNQNRATMNGHYLREGNPHLAGMVDNATESMARNYKNSVMPGINASFGGAGRTGSMAHLKAQFGAQQQLADAMGDAVTNIYGQNYEAERQRQMQATQMAPALAETDYRDINAVLGAGQQVDAQAQRYLDDEVARFNHYQSAPDDHLARYIAAIQGNYGGQASTSSSSSSANRNQAALAQGVGGAMAGASAGAQMGSNGGPWGAVIGGLLGAGSAYL